MVKSFIYSCFVCKTEIELRIGLLSLIRYDLITLMERLLIGL